MKNGIEYSKVTEIKSDLGRRDFSNIGTVYVIEFSNGLLKIGKSFIPKKRIKTISAQIPFSINRIFISKYHLYHCKTELLLHKTYKANRLNGEYFNCNFDIVVRFINSLKITERNITKQEIKDSAIHQEKVANILIGKTLSSIRLQPPTEHDTDYHCVYCRTPKDIYTPLKTYNNDKGCLLYSDLFDDVFNEDMLAFERFCILGRRYKKLYPDCMDYTKTLKEIFDSLEDCGVINYAL